MVERRIHILRPGAITAVQLQQAANVEVVEFLDTDNVRRSPGTQFRHYAPTARVVLCRSEDEVLEAMSHPLPRLLLAPYQPEVEGEWRRLSAQTLYAELRRADALGVDEIIVLCAGSVQADRALMDRLERAAGMGLPDEGT
jgi:L-threonylcarbamoyladenylate synthase